MLFYQLYHPNKLYTHLNQALLFCLICHTPTKNRGLSLNPRPFSTNFTMKKLEKNWGSLDWLQLSATTHAQWWRLVASNIALNLLYWAMHAVSYRRTAAAIKMASLFGTLFCCRFVFCCPGGCWGNMEQVVARWRRPVASGVALSMLHWVMCFISHRRTAMAINMANNGGTCWCHCWFCHQQ